MRTIWFFIYAIASLAAYSQNFCSVSSLPPALQSNVIAYYPFCANANDVSGNNYNGTVINATLTTDRYGNTNSAYFFNGTSAHILTTTPFMNASWNQYSIAFWFNTSSTSKFEQCCFNTLPHNSIGIGYNYSGGAQGHVAYGMNSNPNNVSWDVFFTAYGNYTNYTTNQWNHIVVVKNGTSWTQYVNGVVDHTISSTVPITNTITNIHMGGIQYPNSSVYGEFFHGKLDDYIIFNKALSPSEVQTLYCLPPPAPGAISGGTTICLGSQTNYGVAPVAGATSYTWTTPPGWIGSSSTNSIMMSPISGTYIIQVAATNSCGSSATSSIMVQVGDCETGFQDNTSGKNQLSIYPNPAHDKINLVIHRTANTISDSQVAIYSLDGKLMDVIITKNEAGIYVVETNSLSKGIYMLRYDEDNYCQHLKLVIQ
jgi:hypothetical protein